MTYTLASIEGLLVAWFNTFGMPVIFENQNAPQPTKAQYVSLYGPRIVPQGEVTEFIEPEQPDADDVTIASSQQFAIFLTVTVYRDGDVSANDVCWTIARQIYQLPARLALEPLAVVDVDVVQQVPQLQESQFEQRSQFTVELRLGNEDRILFPIIKSVSATGTLAGEIAGDVTLPINVTTGA